MLSLVNRLAVNVFTLQRHMCCMAVTTGYLVTSPPRTPRPGHGGEERVRVPCIRPAIRVWRVCDDVLFMRCSLCVLRVRHVLLLLLLLLLWRRWVSSVRRDVCVRVYVTLVHVALV